MNTSEVLQQGTVPARCNEKGIPSHDVTTNSQQITSRSCKLTQLSSTVPKLIKSVRTDRVRIPVSCSNRSRNVDGFSRTGFWLAGVEVLPSQEDII
jgi:hypothetical protein